MGFKMDQTQTSVELAGGVVLALREVESAQLITAANGQWELRLSGKSHSAATPEPLQAGAIIDMGVPVKQQVVRAQE